MSKLKRKTLTSRQMPPPAPSRSRNRNGEKARLKRIVRKQTQELSTKNKKLKQGAKQQKTSEKKILQIELEIVKQREELLHVTRVGKLSEFVSSLAHEISQPLTSILSYAQAAKRMLGDKDPHLQEILQYIVNDGNRAAMTVQRLRSLLKKSPSDTHPLDMNKLIQEMIGLISTDAIVRGVIVKTALDGQLPLVQGDDIQLQQVLLNLISNSFEAMEGLRTPRQLVIDTSRKGANIVVSVKDSGCGIPQKDLPKLFSHFFTSKSDGLGMGLSISRSIVEAHGGHLEGKNNPDAGATFSFTLPAGK